jgi:outer membrane murein-binding lipoprotein Lpp
MKMYNTPKTETVITEEDSVDKKIKMLDLKVSRLAEEVSRIKSMVQATSRQTRRQNTDINNLTTVVRNR